MASSLNLHFHLHTISSMDVSSFPSPFTVRPCVIKNRVHGVNQDDSPVISKINTFFPKVTFLGSGPIFWRSPFEPPTPANLKVLKSLLLQDLLSASSMPGSAEWGLLYNTPTCGPAVSQGTLHSHSQSSPGWTAISGSCCSQQAREDPG